MEVGSSHTQDSWLVIVEEILMEKLVDKIGYVMVTFGIWYCKSIANENLWQQIALVMLSVWSALAVIKTNKQQNYKTKTKQFARNNMK